MPRIALAIAYDGTAFDSYARQPGHRTVEGELLSTLRAGAVAAQRFLSGSRTDAGVSAAWNVVAFDTDRHPGEAQAAGAKAPAGLHFLAAVEAVPAFDPRRARRRTYAYLLPPPWDFDWSRARPAARLFVGEHNLRNFSRPEPGRPDVRRIDALRYRKNPERVEVTAPAFAWQEVRRIVAALRGASDGDRSVDDIGRALQNPGRVVDFGLAPAEPLVLIRADYDGLRFPPLSRLARDRIRRAWGAADRNSFLYGTLEPRGPKTSV